MPTFSLTLVNLRDLVRPLRTTPAAVGVDIGLAPRRVAQALALGIAFVAAAGATVSILTIGFGRDHLMGLARLARLGGAGNMPVWLASMELLAGAGTAMLLSYGARQHRTAWRMVAVALALLSLNEAAALREVPGAPLGHALGAVSPLAWVLAAGLVATFAVLVVRLLRRLPVATSLPVLTAAACYGVGASLLSMSLTAAGAPNTALSAALAGSGATLKMGGVALFIVVLLVHAKREGFRLTLLFDDREGARLGMRARMRVSPRLWTWRLLGIVALLATISVLAQWQVYVNGVSELAPFARMVNLTREGNVPTWWQTSVLLSCGVLAGIVAHAAFSSRAPYRGSWALLALGFLYLSLDEGAAIHELSVEPLRQVFDASGLLYYPWVVLGAGACVVAAIVLRGFMGALPPRSRVRLTVAAAVFVAGALGVESMTAMFAELYGRANFGYALLTTVEETLEMTGAVLAARALMMHIRDHVGPIRVGREPSGRELAAAARG